MFLKVHCIFEIGLKAGCLFLNNYRLQSPNSDSKRCTAWEIQRVRKVLKDEMNGKHESYSGLNQPIELYHLM